MSKLFDERIVAVQPSLVRAVGSVTVAAVVQQIHYHAEYGHTESFVGAEWVKRTYADLANEIGLTCEQVRRAVNKLEAAGIVEVCQPEGHLRTKWYRLNYDSPALSDSSNRRNGQMEVAKRPIPIGENATSSSTKNLKREQTEDDASRRQRAEAILRAENEAKRAALDDFEKPDLDPGFFDRLRTGSDV